MSDAAASDRQRTIAKEVSLKGAGLHTGQPCILRVLPAPAGAGIVFVRTDLPHRPAIPAAAMHSEVTAGASAPPARPPSDTELLAKPRVEKGIQRRRKLAVVAYAPDWPMPSELRLLLQALSTKWQMRSPKC